MNETAKKLTAKKNGLRVIDRGTVADARGHFKRAMRAVESGEYGTPRAFVGSFICGFGNDRQIKQVAFGVATPEEQQMAARCLRDFLEAGSK